MILSAPLVAAALAGAVVVGVADVDGTRTDIGTADGALAARCTVEHGRGMLPKGAVVDDHRVVLAVADDKGGQGGRGARVVLLDLRTCAARTLFDEALQSQAPVVVDGAPGQRVVYAVREVDPQPYGAHFEVVRDVIDDDAPAVVVTARDALWVKIAQGAAREQQLMFLVGEGSGPAQDPGLKATDGDGAFHVDVLDGGDLRPVHALGRGTFKGIAVIADRGVVVEEVRGAARGLRVFADDKPAEHGRFVPLGLAAAPFAARGHLLTSNGKKDGGLVADGVPVAAARVGIARPVAIDGDVVVVDVDRGAALPRELWSVPLPTSKKPPRRLLVPAVLTAVEVYGVTSPASSPATSSPKGGR